MALDSYQQVYNLFGKAKNILIIAGHNEIEDTYPASVALCNILATNERAATLFSATDIPGHFYFLDNKHKPQKSISGTQDVVVSIDASQNPVKQISYSRDNSHLNIYISPEDGTRIGEGDMHIKLGKFNYDLIVALGLQELEGLGEEFERNASFFFETPIINIDKNSSNERFGEVNVIELTSSSCSEILTNLLRAWDEEMIKKDIATSLLCGIIASTNNFQNTHTTPNTLFASAHLMSRDGDQQEIIKNVFKTKSFELLKVWGIAMSKLQYKEKERLAWLILTQGDFQESNSTPKAIPSILAELKNNFSHANTFVVFWENHNSYFGLINTIHGEQLDMISKTIEGDRRGNNLVFSLPSKDAAYREKIIHDLSRILGV